VHVVFFFQVALGVQGEGCCVAGAQSSHLLELILGVTLVVFLLQLVAKEVGPQAVYLFERRLELSFRPLDFPVGLLDDFG